MCMCRHMHMEFFGAQTLRTKILSLLVSQAEGQTAQALTFYYVSSVGPNNRYRLDTYNLVVQDFYIRKGDLMAGQREQSSDVQAIPLEIYSNKEFFYGIEKLYLGEHLLGSTKIHMKT